MTYKRRFRLPIALLLPRVIIAKTFEEHRRVIVSEALILENECPFCTHQDDCIVFATRIAYYPHLVDSSWEYPESPDIWILQSRIYDAQCKEFKNDPIKVANYKKPVYPMYLDED